jgi:hypothetical protein
MAKEILCGFGVDVDAVAGWLGSYAGEESPDDISRGLFGRDVRALRHAGRRVRLANQVLIHFGLRPGDWQGSAFLLAAVPARPRWRMVCRRRNHRGA